MLFITTDAGEKVGTASAWWVETADGGRFPLVHWVAIKPAFQKRGLGNPLMAHLLAVLKELEAASPILVQTQTWSHIAIHLYEKFGFEMMDKKIDGSPIPDYEKAMAILRHL